MKEGIFFVKLKMQDNDVAKFHELVVNFGIPKTILCHTAR
jgi:hypothetical protein